MIKCGSLKKNRFKTAHNRNVTACAFFLNPRFALYLRVLRAFQNFKFSCKKWNCTIKISTIYIEFYQRTETLPVLVQNDNHNPVLRSAERVPAIVRLLHNRKWRQSYCSVGDLKIAGTRFAELTSGYSYPSETLNESFTYKHLIW